MLTKAAIASVFRDTGGNVSRDTGGNVFRDTGDNVNACYCIVWGRGRGLWGCNFRNCVQHFWNCDPNFCKFRKFCNWNL